MNVCPVNEPELRSDSGSSLESIGDDHALSGHHNSSIVLEEERTTEIPEIIGRRPMSPEVLDAYLDCRQLVRLIQCEICSKALHQPISLPCGETLCRTCLPTTYERQHISYPNNPARATAFICPFSGCGGREHSLADCDLDITLTNILGVVDEVLRTAPNEDSVQCLLVSTSQSNVQPSSQIVPEGSVTIIGGRLSATYQLAVQGGLPYDSIVSYLAVRENADSDVKERELLAKLVTSVRSEFDCQVCYSLFHEPTTTSCGHTFCRSCLERARDHSNLCPFCRRSLTTHRSLASLGSNKRLQALLLALCPEDVESRENQDREAETDGEHTMPIFICTLSFPHMPMFLHIFEPRYRLMLRRAVENGTRCFGMVSHIRGYRYLADGNFEAPFTQYGTMLYITGLQIFPDGRSLIEAVGTYRFKIVSYSWSDGYPLAKIERVDDIPYADEEAMEAMERVFHTFPEGSIPEWARASTQELLEQGITFVNTMRNSSAGWFADGVLRTYGQPPNDPAIFPFWLATLLPVHEREKYMLLVSTSVRERLKMVIGWIKALESRSWQSNTEVANIIRHITDLNTESNSDVALLESEEEEDEEEEEEEGNENAESDRLGELEEDVGTHETE